MDIPNLVLPVFAVILTGWLAAATGYMPRAMADALVRFAYNVAMPALIFLTIAQQPLHALLDWRFLAAFGGGSLICFAAVMLYSRMVLHREPASAIMIGLAAGMTNTTFVALPILQALYGQRGVLPAAIATVFIAVIMLPMSIVLLELAGRDDASRLHLRALTRQIVINPVMISTVLGLLWSLGQLPMPTALAAYTGIFGEALTPCALFAIGLGLTSDGLMSDLAPTTILAVIKLLLMPILVYGLCRLFGLSQFETLAAVMCAAVPTAKTAFIHAGEYRVEQSLVASTISLTTLLSVVTLLGWLYVLNILNATVQ